MQKITTRFNFGTLEALSFLAVAYSAYLAFGYASQPPLDIHAFRQTQTALTAYWFTEQGFKWAYETPVGGIPWAIPFEFPIYQIIVAGLSHLFEISLDFSGRAISYVFLVMCLFPVCSITRQLKLPDNVFAFFVAILFSMPLYLYWGRSFMIETPALFFTIAGTKYFIDYFMGKRSCGTIVLFILFSSFAFLQKSTTILPVFVFLALSFTLPKLTNSKTVRDFLLNKDLIITGVIFVIPVSIGFAWIVFTDQVKLENPLGAQLTSAELSQWNWGKPLQRVSPALWFDVIWERILSTNMGGALGLFLIFAPFLLRTERRIRLIVLSTIVLGFAPVFLFTNLHIVHDYYQSATVIFLAYGLAVALGSIILPAFGKAAAVFMMILIMSSNYIVFSSRYLPNITKEITKENRDLAIGDLLNRELPTGMQFVAYGNGWSSTFSYISKRKSFTAPKWLRNYDQVLSNPENFVEEGHLGAIVSCKDHPNVPELISWAKTGRSWKVGETHGCLIATPEKQVDHPLLESAQCEGSIDRAEIGERDGHKVMTFAGWTATKGEKPLAPDDVFVKISGKEPNSLLYLQALKVPRIDANLYLGIDTDTDVGFSRIAQVDLPSGQYEIGIVQKTGNTYVSCGIRKPLRVQ